MEPIDQPPPNGADTLYIRRNEAFAGLMRAQAGSLRTLARISEVPLVGGMKIHIAQDPGSVAMSLLSALQLSSKLEVELSCFIEVMLDHLPDLQIPYILATTAKAEELTRQINEAIRAAGKSPIIAT